MSEVAEEGEERALTRDGGPYRISIPGGRFLLEATMILLPDSCEVHLEVKIPRLFAWWCQNACRPLGTRWRVEDGEEVVGGEVVEVHLIKGTYPLA